MPRFITSADYDFKIRSEIKALLDNSTGHTKLIVAEDTAIDTIRKRIGGRYDCNAIFSAAGDERSKFIIDITISIALYKLYQQMGQKDIPKHRQDEYDDAIEWLRDAGKGDIPVSDLPSALSDDNPGEMIINSRTPIRHKT